ncbi:MAG: TIGR03936 family radical SAM-associated protein [Clostridia bacterium]|nr:TIGR03936 family radical SAM-associated protein [Clostridia bacterium]
MRIQAVFEKNERVRHIGHLDIQRAVQRGLRRSGLPVAYSNGFNPHILVSFASALSTGACGRREIMDVTMAEEVEPALFLEKMNGAMPPEMRLLEARRVEDRHPALTALLKAASYDLTLRDPGQAEKLIAAVDAMMGQDRILAVRKSKSGLKECDIKPLIYALRGKGSHLYATLALTERETCKPGMLLDAMKNAAGIPPEEEVRMLVIRTALLGEDGEGRLAPLESL